MDGPKQRTHGIRQISAHGCSEARRDPFQAESRGKGKYAALTRDLSADLQSVFGVGVETVKWFTVRGNYDLDDLVLLGGSRATKSYFFNGQRVAMNKAGVVTYVLGDHPRFREDKPGLDGDHGGRQRVRPNARFRAASSSDLPACY